MNKALYVSIHLKHVEKIVEGIKNHEFRNYVPKREFDTLYVYTTLPKKEIRYILKIGEVIKYPNPILIAGSGNEEFNCGNKTKYAYAISEIYELKRPISLNELREKYQFMPPQAYAYDSKYPDLTSVLEKAHKTKIKTNRNHL